MTETSTNPSARAVDAYPTPDSLVVSFSDGRKLIVPWYLASRRLCHAKPHDRMVLELVGDGRAILWPLIDEALAVAGFVREFPEFITPAVVTTDTNGDK